MFSRKKYRLLRKEMIVPPAIGWQSSAKRAVYRIQALRSIPKYGVKKGDLGGYISSEDVLSQEDSCWVAYNAIAMGNVQIRNDAYLGDTALALCDWTDCMIVLTDSAAIIEDAKFTMGKNEDTGDQPKITSHISGQAIISGNARVDNVKEISGNVQINGDAIVSTANKISGNILIAGRAQVESGVTILGNSVINDNAIIHKKAKLTDCTVRGNAQIAAEQEIASGEFSEEGIFKNPPKEIPEIIIGQPKTAARKMIPVPKDAPATPSAEPKTKTEKALDLFASILADIASYEADIVKIIKYPVMTDCSDRNTLRMTKLRKKAERLAADPADPEFEETVSELEDAFLTAESNALKLAATLLSEADAKKAQKAKDLLSVASNEASSEQEKKVAFVQGFKHLEGVLAVPQVAVDTFRAKIGLQEIEA